MIIGFLKGAFEMKQVTTSDNHSTDFDPQKIIDSILKETSLDQFAATRITRSIEKKAEMLPGLTGALIRGMVLDYMLRNDMQEAYNDYKRVGLPMAEIKKIWAVRGDSVHENANIDAKNPEGIHKHIADALSKEAVLTLLPKRIRQLHVGGDLHIHDLEYFFTRQFCFDSDLRYFFRYGLLPDGTGESMPVAGPAKNAEVAILHAAKALGCMQCMCAGGQGFQNFLTFLSPYLEGKSYDEIKQLMQMFIYEMSQMMVARGAQAVFSSVQLTPGVPKIWRDKPIVWKGQVGPRTYGEFEREVRLAFSAFMDVLLEGDAWGKPFSFPKPEVVVSRDFQGDEQLRWFDREIAENNLDDYLENHLMTDIPHEDRLIHIANFLDLWETIPSYKELYHKCFKVIAKHGCVYLENQLNSKPDTISCVQCCAYKFEKSIDDKGFQEQLEFKDGKHFSLGSMQVVSLNLPRAAYQGKDLEGTIRELKYLIDTSIEIFKIKKQAIDRQPLPFARQGDPVFADLDELSYVIGVVGLNECVQHLTGSQMHEASCPNNSVMENLRESYPAWRVAIRIMVELEMYVKERSAASGFTIALARTPAETTAQRFAVADLLDARYQDAAMHTVKGNLGEALLQIGHTRDLPIEYSNGTHVAVNAPISLKEKIKLEQAFFPIVGGGNIFHIFLNEVSPFFDYPDMPENPSFDLYVDDLHKYIFNIMKTSQIGYIKVSKDTTICKKCHCVRSGLLDSCRDCGSDQVTHMALVTGYCGDVAKFNAAKRFEVEDRHKYSLNEVVG